MGFIGAGAILRDGGSIMGLTTAATLWVVTAIGLFAGKGYFPLALALTLVTVGMLLLLRVGEACLTRK